jgi:hypothetical protein
MNDLCIYCGDHLVLWERSRSYCSTCKDKAEVAYGDDQFYAEGEARHDDRYDEADEFTNDYRKY